MLARITVSILLTTSTEKESLDAPLEKVVWTSPSAFSSVSPLTCMALCVVEYICRLSPLALLFIIRLDMVPVSSNR